MLISVIVPVYNVEKYLDECVESILNQTYTNFELLLIDDGSTDNSGKMCDDLAKKDPRIKVLHQENQGLSATRNNGIKVSKGELLYFIDSDDYIDKNLFKDCVDSFKNNDVEIVIFGTTKISNGKELKTSDVKDYGVTSNIFALTQLLKGDINNYTCGKMYKRCVLHDIVFPVGYHFEDIGIMYKIFLNAKNVYFIEKSYYYYRVNPNSIVGKMSDKSLSDLFLMRNSRYNDLKSDYSEIAQHSFPLLAVSAIRLYDRSLWGNVDKAILKQATDFLALNKEIILSTCQNTEKDVNFKRYYSSPAMYNILRKAKHMIGNIVKRIK